MQPSEPLAGRGGDVSLNQPLLYIRARWGLMEWFCPHPQCGKYNLSHVSYRSGYIVRCKGHHRGNLFVLGHTLRHTLPCCVSNHWC